MLALYIVVVVVVDSHIQRIVLATEETMVTQQVSHGHIKCQSRLWSQRGTKVNGYIYILYIYIYFFESLHSD